MGRRLARKIYSGKPLVERSRQLRQSQTGYEAALWDLLRAGQVDGLKFRRQHQIGQYIADFYCASLKLVIELDGGQHARSENQRFDAERDAKMQAVGLRVLRFPNSFPPEIIVQELRRSFRTLP